MHDDGSPLCHGRARVEDCRPTQLGVTRMARHRFGARGNALTFPLPLEDLFAALQGHAEEANQDMPLKLPRMGEELGRVARVLLKINKEGATTEEHVKTLIHQAVVRREVRGGASCMDRII